MNEFHNSFDESLNRNIRNNVPVPAAPIKFADMFQLSKTSFDFNLSQVIERENVEEGYFGQLSRSRSRSRFTPRPNETLNTPERLSSLDVTEGLPQSKKPFHTLSNTLASSQRVENRTRPEIFTPSVLKVSSGNQHDGSFNLRSVEEIPVMFQHIFPFPYFNILQSTVYDAVLYTDKSVVVSAPTGSGKTAVFEMALVRLLMKIDRVEKAKIIYMAPMKALCTERFQDWSRKFQKHGLVCLELTGDTEVDDLAKLHNVNLVCTTPEKWDSMSRRWKDKQNFFQDICLFLVDEIHTLNDTCRGATIEAVISRMKMLHTTSASTIRFMAVSATLPNYLDIAEWLKTPAKSAVAFNIDERHRPVRLERFAIGYPFKEGSSDFRFDMNLSYKLRGVIETYSHGKPTLVFCSSRKSVIQTAEILAKDMNHILCRRRLDYSVLQKTSKTIHEPKVKEFLLAGIGIHHAGLLVEDRSNIEDLFRLSQLPVLVSTSTLAMGVNLPAHLVIIKSTHFYNMGAVLEYSDMQILQMIGRAGRPQFDTSATAVIMTKAKLKNHYQALVSGTQFVESSLHKNLIEHLNAEIVLQTINDMAMAIEWMRHTFLYVRVIKNAKHYGLPEGLTKDQVEQRLQDLCLRNLNSLTYLHLVSVQEETYEILPTDTGRLMARYCIAFETMKLFHSIDPKQDNITDMLNVVSQCAEFEEIQLRTNEKRILNMLNKDKQRETIRFPLPGKIKTKQMKVNCLLQAQLSNLPIHDFSLSQDVAKIFRVGQRVTKCLMEMLYQGKSYNLLLHATLIYKALKTKLWYDSRFLSRQLEGIGLAMSLNLANSGYYSFQKLEEANPREIELIVNRHPPFGNQIREAISHLPRYELAIDQLPQFSHNRATLVLKIDLVNRDRLEENAKMNKFHQSLLIIGDEDNAIVFKWRINDCNLLQDGSWSRTVDVRRASAGTNLNISLLSLYWVGLDILTKYEPRYSSVSGNYPSTSTPAAKLKTAMDKCKGQSSQPKKADLKRKTLDPSSSCHHPCLDKANCGHQCCKSTKQMRLTQQATALADQPKIEPYVSNYSNTADNRPQANQDRDQALPIKLPRITLKKFAYVKPKPFSRTDEDSKEKPAVQNTSNLVTTLPSRIAQVTYKKQDDWLMPSIRTERTRHMHINSMRSDVDNFIATKTNSIDETGDVYGMSKNVGLKNSSSPSDDIQEKISVHSSDEDLCAILNDITCDQDLNNYNAPNQILHSDQRNVNPSTSYNQPQSSEIPLDLSLSSSTKSSNIHLSQSAVRRKFDTDFTLTKSPDAISLGSSLSQQFPLQDTWDNHSSSSEKAQTTDIHSQTQGSAKSPHRYGLVHAWPRPNNVDKHLSGNVIAIPSSKKSYPQCEMDNINVTSTKSNACISSIFVPRDELPTSESYLPGKLFDGIFDNLF